MEVIIGRNSNQSESIIFKILNEPSSSIRLFLNFSANLKDNEKRIFAKPRPNNVIMFIFGHVTGDYQLTNKITRFKTSNNVIFFQILMRDDILFINFRVGV